MANKQHGVDGNGVEASAPYVYGASAASQHHGGEPNVLCYHHIVLLEFAHNGKVRGIGPNAHLVNAHPKVLSWLARIACAHVSLEVLCGISRQHARNVRLACHIKRLTHYGAGVGIDKERWLYHGIAGNYCGITRTTMSDMSMNEPSLRIASKSSPKYWAIASASSASDSSAYTTRLRSNVNSVSS